MPEKGGSYIDPDYNSTIIRITDKSTDGYSGPGIENEYARSDPENSDGSYLILRGNDGEWYLYRNSDHELTKHLTDIVGGGQEVEPRWDASNPDIFYYLYGTELRSYNINTDNFTTVHDFADDVQDAVYITTQTEGDASLDRNHWCFMVQDDEMALLSVLVYNRGSDQVTGQNTAAFPDGINWVSMDMNGNHCVIGYEDSDTDGDDQTPPLEVFSRTKTKIQTLPEGSTGHMDLAIDADGNDVMVYQNNATDWIAMADLETGIETNLVQILFNINGDIGIHVSGNCAETPGWVLVSTYGSKNPPEGQEHSWMDNLLFMLELKEDPIIEEIASTHAYTSLNFDGEKNYFAEAFAAINTSGTTIYFGSNWEDYTQDYKKHIW